MAVVANALAHELCYGDSVIIEQRNGRFLTGVIRDFHRGLGGSEDGIYIRPFSRSEDVLSLFEDTVRLSVLMPPASPNCA